MGIMKLKLNPSSRMKKRYLLLNAGGKESVEKAILDYIGVLGWAKASPIFVESKNGRVILAVNRKEVESVRAAFEISDSKIIVLNVSGTLKGLEN